MITDKVMTTTYGIPWPKYREGIHSHGLFDGLFARAGAVCFTSSIHPSLSPRQKNAAPSDHAASAARTLPSAPANNACAWFVLIFLIKATIATLT